MSNLTVAVDDQLIKRARVRAIEQGTSLSAKVREFLLSYVNEPHDALSRQREQNTARLLAALDAAASQVSAAATPVASTAAKRQRSTLRDELYAGDFRARDRQSVGAAKSTAARPRTKAR